MTTSFVDTVKDALLPDDQYVDQTFKKSMIFLHHTASDSNPFGVQEYWISTKEKVGTQFIIAGTANSKKEWADGGIYQCCNSAKGIWHLGTSLKDLERGGKTHTTSTFLNMNSVGIELTNYGYLKEVGQAFQTVYGNKLPDSRICELKVAWRGYHYFEDYTDAQIDSLHKLIIYLCDKYSVPQKWMGLRMFDICPDVLDGVSCIAAHCSVRIDKLDVYPSPKLIAMLTSL